MCRNWECSHLRYDTTNTTVMVIQHQAIRTIGSRKLGCDDEIDAKDAQTENQALTFFGLDVNKSDVKEGCAPGE